MANGKKPEPLQGVKYFIYKEWYGDMNFTIICSVG